MLLEPLSEKLQLELVVTPVGNAMLLYKGTLDQEYSWAQYDSFAHSVQFVTEAGGLQELGFEIPSSADGVLMKTRELMMVELREDASLGRARLIKFMGMGV